MTPLRSLLFCPATSPDKVRKIPTTGADAAAIDLEDAVSDDLKADARQLALNLIATPESRGYPTYVRINSVSTGRAADDIAAIVHPHLDGIVLSKTDSADDVRAADQALERAEAAAGIQIGCIRILPLIETAKGVHNAVAILSASPRVLTGIFGFVDYMLDVGINLIDHTPDADELLFARSAVVNASRVAGVTPPLDGPFLGVDTPDALRQQCRQARTLGFRGKMLIHPRQVALAHEGFAPTPGELEQAQRVLDAFSAAEAQGRAAVVVDGRLVDYPVVYRARRILEGAS